MGEHGYKHLCGNCQIRIYIQRHYNEILTWENCPYPCEYGTERRRSEKKMQKPYKETAAVNIPKEKLAYFNGDGLEGRTGQGGKGNTLYLRSVKSKIL